MCIYRHIYISASWSDIYKNHTSIATSFIYSSAPHQGAPIPQTVIGNHGKTYEQSSLSFLQVTIETNEDGERL